MRAEKVKVEFSNLETHLGNFREQKFRLKADITYEDMILTIAGRGRIAKLHARNIGNMALEKKAIWISAMNFEIQEGDKEPSVVSGSIRIEIGKDAETWFKEIWG